MLITQLRWFFFNFIISLLCMPAVQILDFSLNSSVNLLLQQCAKHYQSPQFFLSKLPCKCLKTEQMTKMSPYVFDWDRWTWMCLSCPHTWWSGLAGFAGQNSFPAWCLFAVWLSKLDSPAVLHQGTGQSFSRLQTDMSTFLLSSQGFLSARCRHPCSALPSAPHVCK